jgi:hypothetical protein
MRRRLPLLLVLLLALLVSCSAVRMTYDNADWLLAHLAGRYVDMDREQARALKLQIAQLHAWHRREELPRYAALLDEAAARVERGLTRDDVAWAVAAVRARSQALGSHAAAGLAPLLVTLNDRQIGEVEVRFAADNRKYYAAKLSGSSSEAVTTQADWFCARLEDWTGDVTPAQRELVMNLMRAFPDLAELRLADRKRRQAQLLALLREHPDQTTVQTRLVTLSTDPYAGSIGPYRDTLVAAEARSIDTLVALDRSLTPRQRATIVQRMRRYAQEFRSLAQENGKGQSTSISARPAG